jgi:hypothetical protein
VRGSSSAVARSAIRIAISTATVIRRNSALHERVVLALHRLQEHEADAGVVEDVLDQDRAADHEPERHREAGQVRQDRVAGGVVEHDPPAGQALGPGHPLAWNQLTSGPRGHAAM